ncbi:hypothetical protein PHMEG_00032833 [Phytophthora megakarya]|uniref:ATP-dependent DNA helicase n=1 Tax=Phytophthora megakarya TaxID=4795 RepID=A0A225UW92_9STRA|nr:hypothetical protein PHMEG_00032833 [Phytophthora megakarya]
MQYQPVHIRREEILSKQNSINSKGNVVPVVIGPIMTYVDDHSPDDIRALRSKIVLVLFKPFRGILDLVQSENPSDIDWIQAYSQWLQHRSADVKTLWQIWTITFWVESKRLLTGSCTVLKTMSIQTPMIRTGKSRVTDAVTRLCSGWKCESCFLRTALTGKTATLIQGITLASLLVSLERFKSDDLHDIDMLIIDKVSMITNLDWLKLDALLRRRKTIHGVPFGGIHVVLVGDVLQPLPVGSDPIFVNSRNKSRYSAVDI